jgi:hypothetical protein
MDKSIVNKKLYVSTSFNKIEAKDDINEEINTPTYRRSAEDNTERKNESVSFQNISHLREMVVNKIEEEDKIHVGSLFQQVILVFSDKSELTYDVSIVIECCPAIAPYLINQRDTDKNIQIEIPNWISCSNMIEYFLYINDEKYLNFKCSVNKILAIADYFNNQTIITKLLRADIIPNINIEDSFLYLDYSYNKLSNKTDNYVWFDLFYESINFIAANLPYYLKMNFSKIQEMKIDIVEEIIEK